MKFLKIVQLCYYTIFNQQKFTEEEKKYNASLIKNNENQNNKKDQNNVVIIKQAFWHSLGLIIAFTFFGSSVGLFLCYYFNQPPHFVIITIQVIGTCLLLWGTLFIRGWEIQTWDGTTLIEKVNRWIYKSLCCFGTTIIMCSLIWPLK